MLTECATGEEKRRCHLSAYQYLIRAVQLYGGLAQHWQRLEVSD